jgi:nucleoside-diphosphate-sugar epimerase
MGASGYIGSAIAGAATAASIAVRNAPACRVSDVGRLSQSPGQDAMRRYISVATRWVDKNQNAYSRLLSVLSRGRVVVNAAGLAIPGSCWRLVAANVVSPLMLSLACWERGVRRLVHVSGSAAVQGRRSILDEPLECSPFSPYSASKALGSALLCVCNAAALA